ncbi:MAG: hypothetical protein V3574_03740 [Candidatus Moraniibacteriota bacterium]
MGQLEIIEKLKHGLEEDIHEECQVVYILSRIRKILEIKNQKTKYRFLNFYCNWSLHSKIDRKETTDLLRVLLEKNIDSKKSGKENAIKLKLNNNNFFKLSSFKQELTDFLQENNLPLNVVKKSWISFIKILLEIIKESPIIFTSNVLNELKLSKDVKGNYCYKFTLVSNKNKPIVKLKFEFD